MGVAIKAFFDFLTELFGWVESEARVLEKVMEDEEKEVSKWAEQARDNRAEKAKELAKLLVEFEEKKND